MFGRAARSPTYVRLEPERTSLTEDDDGDAGSGADDEDHEDKQDPTQLILQPLFDELRSRLANASRQKLRPSGSTGMLVNLTIGKLSWLVDLRDGVAADRVIKRVSSDSDFQADVTISIPLPTDLKDLLQRRLSPFRALAQKKLLLSGDLRKLHAMEWLLRAG